MEIFEEDPKITDPAKPMPWPTGIPSVTLEGVRFAYDDVPVLDGLDLRIEPGEKVALVGSSGSGKSTIGRLLTRQYDADQGGISVGGVAVESLALKDLRRNTAIVTQEPVLFDVSLRENLRYAKPDASDQELLDALALAQVVSVVDELEEGLDTTMGSRGDRLSGGQRQRVAIARAILQDSPVLVLDEATAALDGFTEHRLLQALRKALADRTVIVIAHRPSAIVWADRVVMVEAGKVLDHGSPTELYGRCAAYRRLIDEQETTTVDTDAIGDTAPTGLTGSVDLWKAATA
jgi:ATP-binding cassette subfamily B protein